MSHSPGKLEVERNVIAGDIIHLALTARQNGREWMVASVTPMSRLRPIDEANAARLAHCWNTHDELVRACKAALTKLESLNEEHNRTGVMLEEVLAKEAM
jgi:hypothetical protein